MTGPRSPIFASARRAPRRRWVGVLKVTIVLLLVAVAIAAVVVAGLWGYAVSRLGGDPLQALAGRDGRGTAAEGTTTTLVAVVDNAAAPQSLESPVVLIQTGEPRGDTPVGVLLPPDLQVSAEGLGTAPLHDTVAEGGLDLLLRTATDYTGLAIDHYVVTDPDGLPDLIETLEGVERCDGEVCRRVLPSDVPALDHDAGVETLATLFSQVQATADRLRDPWVLAQPWRAKAAIDLVADRIRTNVSLRGQALYAAAEVLAEPRSLDVRPVPTVVDPEEGVLLAFAERAEQLFQPLRDGTPLPGDAGRTEEQEILRSEVRILVWNGAGTAGLAAQIEAKLTAEGFAVVATDNAPRFGRETTEIAYGPDALPFALLVAEHFDGAELRESERPLRVDGEPVDVRVTAGLDQVDD